MAIKKKTVSTANELPENIDQLSLKAFTEQYLKTRYEECFKETKVELFAAIESSDLELTIGESFKTKYGTILISETKRKKVDNDKLIDLINKGKISIEQVLACVSTFKNEELEKTLSTPIFEKVSTFEITQSTVMKSNAEFKAQCETQFNAIEIDAKPKSPPPPHPMAPVEKVSSKDKLKKAMAKTKKVEVDADDELDSILNS